MRQYTAAINSHHADAISANAAGLDANMLGAQASVANVLLQAASEAADGLLFLRMGAALLTTTAYGVAPLSTAGGIPGSITAAEAAAELGGLSAVDALSYLAAAAEVGLTIDGINHQRDALANTQAAHDLTSYVAGLPECDTIFTGTVRVSAGGMNVTGPSIFNGDVGVAGSVHVQGQVTASQIHATQGISAAGGKIWLGDPNGTTYSSGITIGGGAVSGAGFGGAQAFTNHVNAMAIGNNAKAWRSGSLALGLNASAGGADAVAIGTGASANGTRDVVVGVFNETGEGGNNTVVGNDIAIVGDASADNTVLGSGHQVAGSGNFVGGDPNTVVGSYSVATGANSTVVGDSNVAVGDSVTIHGDRAIAVGNRATAAANDTTAIGTNARASAAGSAAYGHGAVASQPNQQVFGTEANTYTTPGITSALSRARQAGPLQVPTTDAAGNLATDGGQIFDALSRDQAGIAVAMALETPSLQAGETFGIAVNWGAFAQSQAFGVSAMGVVARDLFSGGGRLSLTGSFGGSLKEESFGGRSTNAAYGGRAGVQLSW